ncbi:hypothetical protein ACF0H5_017025 [Mactra antiquata]
MVSVQVTLILLSVVVVNGLESSRLWNIPSPVNGFRIQPLLGRWFVQYRKAPCTWGGSNEFSDYETTFQLDGKHNLFTTMSMRNDVCNTINSRAFMQSPGVYIIKDPLGNNFSGKLVFAATDYKTYHITYLCTKMSVLGEKCDDTSLSVKTRVPHPDHKIIARINHALNQMWGISVDHLQRVNHLQCKSS